jgi:hypothetical protein
MKFIFLLIALVTIGNTAFCQSKSASYCGTGCSRLTIKADKKTDYGVKNSTVFDISNNLPGKVKVKLYVKRKDGEWMDQGVSDPIDQGKSFAFHYNRDDLSGDFCVYYINYPSDEKFPLASEVKKKMNYGYGN